MKQNANEMQFRENMPARRLLRYFILMALTAELVANMGLAATSFSNHNSGNFLLEINDSVVNTTIGKHPFFVLDYYAPGCMPCESMDANINQLSAELDGQVVFGKISIEDNNLTAKRLGIEYFPTLLVFRNGTPVHRTVGYISKSAVAEMLKGEFPGLNVSRVKAAADEGAAGKPAAPKASSSSKKIPLAMLGIDKPASPMLVTDANLGFALNKYPLFVLMGFAEWCEYCENMNSTVSELARELSGQVAFGLLNAEINNRTAEKYNITSYPRFYIFKNGSLVKTHNGSFKKSSLVAALMGVDSYLDTGRVNLTESIAPPFPEPATSQRSGSREIFNATLSGDDEALKYLDRILAATSGNRSSGVTINIFVIDACPKTK